MQPKNTIMQLKKLIGLRYSDPEVQEILPTFLFPTSAGPNGEIMITVQYMGEQKTFTPERLVAMVLSDLKTIAEADHGAKVTDAVVSVPVSIFSRKILLALYCVVRVPPCSRFTRSCEGSSSSRYEERSSISADCCPYKN